MKRFCVILLCFCFAATAFCFAACADDEKTTVRLNEVTHSVFYAPLYIAINNGYFDETDIKIELTNGGGADKVMTALVSGGADIGLMGVEACIYTKIQGIANNPVVFGQLTKRDGSFLVSKKDEAATFKWTDLAGKNIIIGRQGGMPAMTMEYILNKYNLYDGVNCTMDKATAFNNMGNVFYADSSVHYTTLFEPTASEFAAAGKGYIVASVGSESGEVPYTAFTALSSYLTKNRDIAKKFLAAVYKGYIFMTENDSATVAHALAPSFDGTSLESLVYAVDSYLAIDAWSNTPVMTAAAFDKLQDIMINAGELAAKTDFSAIVDNSIAREVVGLA